MSAQTPAPDPGPGLLAVTAQAVKLASFDHVLTRAKAYAALLGALVTATLGTVPPHTQLWTALTLVSALATAVVTFAVPNATAPAPEAVPAPADLLQAAPVTPAPVVKRAAAKRAPAKPRAPAKKAAARKTAPPPKD